MLVPIKQGELNKLVPAVATGNQFREALGNPQKILQRVLISSIGGVITLLISQGQVGSQFFSLWLIIGVGFLLYLLWGPIIEAGQKNSKIRKYPYVAIFYGQVANIYTRERIENRQEQANRVGELEIVENRRTWIFLELEDEDGYLGDIAFPMDKVHESIRIGSQVRCLVFSQSRDFSKIAALTDAWLPLQRLWVGEYPYLLRPAFIELCQLRSR